MVDDLTPERYRAGMLFLLACVHPDPTTTPTKESPIEDSTGDSADGVIDDIVSVVVDIRPGTIDTVLDLRWQTPSPAIGWIEWGETEELGRHTPPEVADRNDHALRLAGLAAGLPIYWRPVWRNEDNTLQAGETQTWTPTAAPEETGLMTLTEGGLNDEGYFITTIHDPGMVVIYDRQGRVVWWRYSDQPSQYSMEARYEDGHIWYNTYSKAKDSIGYLYTVSLSQDTIENIELPGSHHGFLRVDGRTLYLAVDARPGPVDQTWVGDQLMIRDQDGTTTRLWSTWDDVGFTRDDGFSFYRYGIDWTHCNGIAYDPATEHYIVTSKGQQAIYGIHTSGGLDWSMGGDAPTLTMASGTPFGTVHAPIIVGDRLYVFDNDPSIGTRSEAVGFTIDYTNNTYTQVWGYAGPWQSFILGSVEPTEGNHMVVSFGSDTGFMEINDRKEVLFKMEGPLSGYVHFIPTLSGPLDL